MDAPASFMAGIAPLREALIRHLPDLDTRVSASPDLKLKDLFAAAADPEKLGADLAEANRKMHDLMCEEIREFGVEKDPDDLRFQWGTPGINEAVVRMIEQRYPAGQNQGNIIFYGPSNITLWFSLEDDMLPYRGQNHGMGGCIDDDLMHYAPRLLYPYAPKAVFFQTGSNDIAAGIPLTTILANKRKRYAMFLENLPDAQLIVCSGLPLPGRTQYWDATVKTNELLRQMCEETDRLHFLDATDAMLTERGPAELRMSDGRYFNPAYFRMDKIHLNKKGHDVWTALMKEKLAELGIEP
jgi:lysophospholipase L1-like esterase